MEQVEPVLQVAVGIVPTNVVQLCSYKPVEEKVKFELVVTTPAFVRVPLMVPAAPVGMVKVNPVASVSLLPCATVKSDPVT